MQVLCQFTRFRKICAAHGSAAFALRWRRPGRQGQRCLKESSASGLYKSSRAVTQVDGLPRAPSLGDGLSRFAFKDAKEVRLGSCKYRES